MALIRLGGSPVPAGEVEMQRGSSHAKRTGRSWWAVRYVDGTVLREWEPDPGSPNKHRDWTRISGRGMQAIRLYCPDGQVANLGATLDATDRIFQGKIGTSSVRLDVGGGLGAVESRATLAHFIGIIENPNGDCTLYSWEILPMPEFRPPVPVPPPPNPDDLSYKGQPGLLAWDYDGWKKRKREIESSPEYRKALALWQIDVDVWKKSARGRLVGPLSDNVWNLRYHNLGFLNADVLKIGAGEGR